MVGVGSWVKLAHYHVDLNIQLLCEWFVKALGPSGMRTHNLLEFCPAFLRPAARRLRSGAKRLRRTLVQPRAPRSRSELFSEIYRGGGCYPRRGWHGDRPSFSGPGSDLEQTAVIRAELPRLLADIGARSILDAPCGDFYWMKECRLDVDQYIGMDIVPALIAKNVHEHAAPGRRFIVGDVVADSLPQVDVIFCRDCLVHLPTREALKAIHNFQHSGSTFLLTTTYPTRKVNENLDEPGEWRPLNLTEPPFGFPPPLRVLNEGCTEAHGRNADKSLGLWRLADLRCGR